MKHFTARSKPRGCFDPSLANHIETPNKPRPKAKQKPTPAQKQRQRVAELRSMPYVDYLRTNHWKRKRAKAIRKAGGRCVFCGATESLQVHHMTYARKGCEQLADLQVLCSDCHKGEHQEQKPWLVDSLTAEFRKICGG